MYEPTQFVSVWVCQNGAWDKDSWAHDLLGSCSQEKGVSQAGQGQGENAGKNLVLAGD